MQMARNPGPFAMAALAFAAAALCADDAQARGHQCVLSDFAVVIDVGHSREAPGATSARGQSEYDFNLVLAQAIERALRQAGFARTILLVTDGPAQQSLFQRVRRANALDAQLFVSVHHDSVPDRFLLNWEHDGIPRQFSDAYRGHSIFVSNHHPQRAASLRFAHLLGTRLKAQGLVYTPHYTEALMGQRRRTLVDAVAGVYRYDQLIVLRHTRMPAVLLEAGSIINRDEELQAASPERQQKIATSVAEAVADFCAPRQPQISARRAQPKPRPQPR